LKEALNLDDNDNANRSQSLKEIVASRINFYNLVIGNMLLTGKYGFYFVDNTPIKKQFHVVETAANCLNEKLLREKQIEVGTVLIKDFYEDESYGIEPFSNFTSFNVQPNMIMDITPWATFDDYLADIKAKYRTRVNRAFKKCKSIRKEELHLEQLNAYKIRMFELYKNIALNAGFNLFIHKSDYFIRLKENLEDKITIIGYFKDTDLVGFFTMIHNRDHLDAHFLGYDHMHNAEYQLYLNMLIDMLHFGISNEFKKLILSRTAMEIKSSIGAQAAQMALYLRHNKPFYNHFVPTLLKYLNPNQEWLPRSPFKDDE
jgi:hypothetical protein